LKVIVLGAGKIGSVMARDFSENIQDSRITMTDINLERVRKAASLINADWTKLDTTNYSNMVELLREYDLVMGALPGDYGHSAIKACIEAGVDMVDVSYTPEDPILLNLSAKDSGVTIIPDCGVAPGLSNLLVGYSFSKLENVKEAKIMVGGIPEIPVPPLGYTITWSADGLIDEYIRDVTIIENGKPVMVTALSGLEEIEFPGVGILEAFYTDGLRSLVTSFPEIENMYEKTLRYPGHVEKVKLLRELGFFSEEPLDVMNYQVIPKTVSARLFERSLWMPEIGDLLAMNIQVTGEEKGRKIEYRHRVLERFDHKTGVSAMARTTAYTASIIAGMLAKGIINEKGVLPLEKLGQDHSIVKELFSELKKREVDIQETKLLN
jgi:saccharopine dehydrogenase-like NADP-dependent oxidoreductase